jgi:transcriptional regulator with XRE-family HTH domain
MNYKDETGRRIKTAREEARLSLAELSAATNGLLSKSRIGNYEQGIRMPGPAEANILASALKSDAAYLMCLQQDLSKQELELIRSFRALPESHRNDYVRRITTLSLAFREPVPDEKVTLRVVPKARVNPPSRVRQTLRRAVRERRLPARTR